MQNKTIDKNIDFSCNPSGYKLLLRGRTKENREHPWENPTYHFACKGGDIKGRF